MPIVVSTVVVFGTLSLCAIIAVTISVVGCYNRDKCAPSRRYETLLIDYSLYLTLIAEMIPYILEQRGH